jgi:hypothetical protein
MLRPTVSLPVCLDDKIHLWSQYQFLLLSVPSLLLLGVLSDERTGTSVTISVGHSQHCHKYSFRTSQETYYVSTTKTNQLMPFGERTAVYSENSAEYTNKLCQNSEF